MHEPEPTYYEGGFKLSKNREKCKNMMLDYHVNALNGIMFY